MTTLLTRPNRLTNWGSKWYQADMPRKHYLTVRHPSNAPIKPWTYWAGMQDALENMDLNTTPMRTWQPPSDG